MFTGLCELLWLCDCTAAAFFGFCSNRGDTDCLCELLSFTATLPRRYYQRHHVRGFCWDSTTCKCTKITAGLVENLDQKEVVNEEKNIGFFNVGKDFCNLQLLILLLNSGF